MESLKKNFFYQSIYQILIVILPIITSPFVSRRLGANGIGVYSYTYTIANYFVLFAMLGINNYGNREIAKCKKDTDTLNDTFSSILVAHMIVATIVLVVYCGYVLFGTRELRIYSFIQIGYILGAVFDINWLFFGLEQFKLTVTRNTVIKLLTTICIFVFIRQPEDLWKYLLILSCGMAISQSIVWLFVSKYVSFKKPNPGSVVKHLKPMAYLFIPVLAVSLYKMMDKIMVGNMNSKLELGFYENASKIVDIPTSIISAFSTVMLPRMSRLVSENDEKTRMDYMEKSILAIICISCAISFGLCGISNNFPVVFWGIEFRPCGYLIVILALHVPIQAYNNIIRTQYLIPESKDKQYVLAVILGALVNVVANMILIPSYHARGAAVGTLLAEVVVCMAQNWFVKEYLPIGKYILSMIPFVLCGIMMGIVVFVYGCGSNSGIVMLCVQILFGGILYILSVGLYFAIFKRDIFIHIIKRKN